MSHKNQTNNYTEFCYHFFRNILLVGIPLVIVSAIVLSSLRSSATGLSSGTDSLTISISSACTLSSVVNTEHNTNTNVGTYTPNIGKTTITTLCNDGNGYSVYATGYGNNEEGNNKLINSSYPQYSIDTGLATSGLTSTWAMKLNNIPDDPSSTPPVIESAYNDTYGLVPSYWTKVASRASGTTDMAEGSSFTTTYAVYASSSQYAGTYQGQVKYLLTHPSYEQPPYFMQDIAYWKDDLSQNQSVQAVDKRDGKKYWVTKLADGNIWMTQNLDLDIIAGSTIFTSDNTDLSTDEGVYTAADTIYTLKGMGDAYGYTYENGIATWVPERSTIAYDALETWDNSDTDPYSYDYLDNNGDQVYPDDNVTQTIAGNHGLAGNYYNWTAALASNDSTNVTVNPTNSICPKGWRLPNSTNKEFGNLLVAYNILETNTSASYISGVSSVDSLGEAPLYFIRSGQVTPSLNGVREAGLYWTSTLFVKQSGKYYANFFGFDSNSISPSYNTKYYGMASCGRSIRCVAR